MSETSSAKAPTFWTTLPGIFTAAAGLITALTAAATAIYPIIQKNSAESGTPAITEFSKKTVLEGAKYKVSDGSAQITVSVDDIKVQRNILFLSVATGTDSPKSFQVTPSEPKAVVVGATEYLFSVHDFADVIVGADTAQLSIARK